MSLYIGSSGIHGSGLFADRTIEASEDIGIVFTRVNNTGMFASDFKENLFGRFTNHSGNPNTLISLRPDSIVLIAAKKININEEITSSYHELIGLFPNDETLIKLVKFW